MVMEDSTMMDASQGLFEEQSFTIIPNGISEDALDKLREQIAADTGTIIPFDSSKGRIDRLEEITYIVSETTDFPDYYRALDLMIHVVKPSWVTDSLRIHKMKNPRTYSPDSALFMSDVVICCGDIPTGDKEAVEGGVVAMGGQIAPSLTKQVTHLLALDMGEERCQLATSKRLQLTILLPHWFDDCLKVGRRISEKPYTLPDPDIERAVTSEDPIPPARTIQQIRDATSPDPSNLSLPPALPPHLEPPRAIKAFAGKKVMLGEDLKISSKLRGVIAGMIKAGGGDVVSKVDRTDIYVCKYREGDDYVKASQDGKDVGNLSWLYYLITHNIWTNPMRRMMHYPLPKGGIPGFEGFRVSISSYTGEARVYLENLVKATGAEFTKTFKQDNTHLITAHKNSEKCEAAVEWGVMVLNHLWLEESYAKCKMMPTTDPRYTYFPPRTNLGEVLGHTEIDRDAVERMFFPKSRKPVKLTKPPTQLNGVPASSVPVSRIHSDAPARNSPVAGKLKSVGGMKTPLPPRHFDGKENQTPGSRGAKDRALAKMHDAAPDIAKFEKEMKRKGGVIHGGRRRPDDEVEDQSKKWKSRDSTASKRSIDDMEDEDATEDEATDKPAKNKRAKKDKLAPIKLRMLVSKDERWTNNDEKASKDKARLRELGLFITDDFKKVDILCAPKPVRTKKFVAALACAPTIVSTTYLDYALKHNKLPAAEKHLLDARDFEEANGFHLDEAMARAKQNKHRLLKGWQIFCTQNIAGGFDTYKDIIEANGGKCGMWKGRTTSITASKRSRNPSTEESQNQKEDEGDVLYLISDPDKKNFANWAKFRELAQKHDMIPRIAKTEWILFVAMAQYVHWKEEWELDEEKVKAGM